jgi:flavin reductase (DIM6/NTAB) family NADH-FMN oxidoreductase RutF
MYNAIATHSSLSPPRVPVPVRYGIQDPGCMVWYEGFSKCLHHGRKRASRACAACRIKYSLLGKYLLDQPEKMIFRLHEFVFVWTILAIIDRVDSFQSVVYSHYSLKLQAAASPVPPPPPISVPVWSFATLSCNIENSPAMTSMNIVTFCTPVSVAPPKQWILSLYHGTLTKESFCKSGWGVLQLLTTEQKHLVPILGKHSGYDKTYSKNVESSKLGFDWVSAVCDIELLPGCALYIQLELCNNGTTTLDAGDHEVFLCNVVGLHTWDADSQSVLPVKEDYAVTKQILYTGTLREESII